MPNAALSKNLSRASEINITVTGRKSGQAISRPIWFVWENNTLYLLPVKGSDTQWYKNILKNPAMRVEAGGAVAESKAIAITDANQVKAIVEKFRGKYGTDVKKYYSKFDVAVIVEMN